MTGFRLWFDHLARDVRHALRLLLRSPGFSATTILSLALAIGANASIFAVVQRVVLNPLPYPESDRIVRLDHWVPRFNGVLNIMPLGVYYTYVDRARSFDALAAYRVAAVTLTGDREPEQLLAARVTPSLGAVLKVPPANGRWFTEEEGQPGAAAVAVLSHGLWVRRYGASPDVVGRSLTLSEVPTTVIGVMPADFAFPDPHIEVWMPDQITRASGFGTFTHIGVARMRAGVTVDDVQADLNRAIPEIAPNYSSSSLARGLAENHFRSVALTLKEATIGNVARPLWILFASASLVLLVACANVANLFVVRSDARQREVAVRRALGASHGIIVRHFLAESTLIAGAGGVLGLVLAVLGIRLLIAMGPTNLPRLHEIRLDGIVVAFIVALSVAAAAAFAAIPLARRTPIVGALHESARGNSGGRDGNRLRRLLMAGQVALVLVLLVATGLMVRSLLKLRAIDVGFNPDSAFTFQLVLPARQYPTRDTAVAAHRRILDRLAELPGVKAVSACTNVPLTGDAFGNTIIIERSDRTPSLFTVHFAGVADGYIETTGIRLLKGRTLDRIEVDRGEPNVLINQAFAKLAFPNADPIGQRVASGRAPSVGPLIWLTIVGVIADTPTVALAEAKQEPRLYMPMAIAGGPDIPRSAGVGPDVSAMYYAVRTSSQSASVLPAVAKAVAAIDPKLAIANSSTFDELIDRAAAQMKFTVVLLAIAASATLFLGVMGIYGVMAYSVRQRRREIGVRLALGQTPAGVVRMIVWQGGLVTCMGLVVGVLSALAGGRFMSALLYDVSPHEPTIIVGAALTLLAIALAACWTAAVQAEGVDPVDALKSE
jgi:putative ABC transport system permease protein